MVHAPRTLRLLPFLLAAALSLAGVAAAPARLAAQCDPTQLDCQEPPSVSITPGSNSWSGTAQSMVLQVQVEFCRSGTYPFAAGGETILFDGTAQSFTNSAVVNGCYTSTGYVTLAAGTHTLTASKSSTGGTGTATETYVYTVTPPPVVPGVDVTPTSGAVKRTMYYGTTETFTVTNTGNGTTSYTLQAACTGAAASCTLTRATVDLAPATSATVGINYTPAGTVGATGAVSLKAWATAQPAVRDSAAYALTVDPLWVKSKPGERPDLRRLDRDVCVILSAGPGAAFECGDLRLVHGLPGLRLRNRSRAPTLIYSSQHASPLPIFAAYVAPHAGTRPDTVRAVLTVNGVSYPGRWPGWPSDTVKRVAVTLPDSLATGVYSYTLTVTGTWNNGAPVQSIYSAANEFVVVNRKGSAFGAGWWLAGLEQLVPAGDRWLWVGGDGGHHVYEKRNATTWVTDTYDRADTLKAVGGLLVRRLPGGTEVRYDAMGYHYQTVNPRGEATTFVWNGARTRLDRIDLPVGGYSYTFTYGNDGGTRLSAVTSPGAVGPRTTTVATVPDGTGRVTQITDPDARFVVFGYTGTDRRVMRRTDRRNWTTRFTYGEGSRLTGSRVPAAVGDTIATTFRAAEGQGIATAAVSVYTYMSGPRSNMSTSWVLDTYGVPYRVAEQLRGDTYIYRSDLRFPGLVTRVDHPNGRIVTAAYDDRGNMTATTDWSNSIGDRYASTLYDWDPNCDSPTRVTGPEGETTTRAYTSFCEPQWVRPAGDAARQVTFAYRALTDTTAPGQLASTTYPQLPGQPSAPVETYEYDARGNLSAVTSPLGTAAGSRVESYADTIGRDTLTRSLITGSAWERTRHVYDVLGRDTLTETIGPALNSQPEQRMIVRRRYDDGGNVLSVLRASVPDTAHVDSVVTRFAYDGVGRKIVETAPDLRSDTTVYDPAGNVVRARSRRGLQVWMEYDALNRLTRRITDSARYDPVTREVRLLTNRRLVGSNTFPVYPNATGGVLRLPRDTATFTYDGMGNLLTADNRDARIRRTYSTNGLLSTDTLRVRTWAELPAGGSFSHVYGLQFTYDLDGRRVQLTHPGTVAPGAAYTQQTYGYDPVTGNLARVTSVLGLNYRFFYNLHGQVDSIAYNDQTGEKLGYDLDGRLSTRRVAGANYKTAVAGVERIHDLSLAYGDRRGKVTTVDDNGTDQADLSMTYSGLGMLLSTLGDAGTPGSGVQHFVETYRFDALGNRVAWRAAPTGGDLTYASFERLTGRLLTTYPPPTTIYTEATPQADSSAYDAAGNLAWYALNNHSGKMFTLTRNYYGADERLRASERWTCAVTNTQVINYDNVSAQCQSPGTLNSATGGAFEDYRYDALGRRVLVRTRRAPYCTSLSCANLITRTVWDGDEILYEIRSGGPDSTAVTLENDAATGSYLGRVAYTHGTGIDRPLDLMRMGYTLQAANGEDYGFGAWGGPYPIIPIGNWRGTVDDAVTAAGRQVPCLSNCSVNLHLPGNSYQAWFTPATEVERTSWFGSLIEEKLDATGQMYMRNRYYNPNTGSFTQEDPIGLAGGMNAYGFANGDPVSYGDPYGLDPCKESSAWTDCLAIALANWGGEHHNQLALYTGAAASAILEATGFNALATAGNHIGNGRIFRGGAQAGVLIGGGAIAQGLGGVLSRVASNRSLRRLIMRYVGEDWRAFLNEAGDLVIQSSDELREVRFDFRHPHPHQSPHAHVIEYRRVKNRKVEVRDQRVFPRDVEQH